MKHVLDGMQAAMSETLPSESASAAGSPSKDSTDYKSSWQRWQSMPGFLEQRRQQLLQKGQVEKFEKPQRPTQEALDFFESLLAGTEHTEEDPISTTHGAAQLQDAARRLQEQAEAVRSLRQKLDQAGSEVPIETNEAIPVGNGTCPDGQSGPKSFEESLEEREASAEARRLEHQRRLQELERAAALEQEQLQAEIDREHVDAAARRDAQEAWFEEFAKNTKKKKEAAERDARARASSFGERDNYWRTRWWRYVPKDATDTDSHGCGHQRSPKPPNFPRGNCRSEHSNFRQDSSDCPLKAPASESPILRELLAHQKEPLQSRKKIWQGPQPTDVYINHI